METHDNPTRHSQVIFNSAEGEDCLALWKGNYGDD